MVKKIVRVIKSSGEAEDLSPSKLFNSLVRSGADSEEAERIIDLVIKELGTTTSTKKIYRLARKYLRKLNRATGLRYSLKRALFMLGPSGYPFEKYYSHIMQHYGFKSRTGVIQEGNCVTHEIDVFAVNDREVHLVECKYHNRPGISVDVKVAMYIHSRFRDIQPIIARVYPGRRFRGWIVTNTRFTTDAMQYAGCYRLNLKSWKYPDSTSLEKMIEEKRLYPVTIISGIKSGLIKKLIQQDIILLKDLIDMSQRDVMRLLSLPENKAVALKRQANELCGC